MRLNRPESSADRRSRRRLPRLRLRLRGRLARSGQNLKAKRLTLDSRYRLLEYRGTGIPAATPNEPEVEAAYHARVGTDTTKLEELGPRALRD